MNERTNEAGKQLGAANTPKSLKKRTKKLNYNNRDFGGRKKERKREMLVVVVVVVVVVSCSFINNISLVGLHEQEYLRAKNNIRMRRH